MTLDFRECGHQTNSKLRPNSTRFPSLMDNRLRNARRTSYGRLRSEVGNRPFNGWSSVIHRHVIGVPIRQVNRQTFIEDK